MRADDGSSMPWDSVRIARVDDKWRYVGRVHEYLTSPARAWTDLYRPHPPIDVVFRATDAERRAQSQVSSPVPVLGQETSQYIIPTNNCPTTADNVSGRVVHPLRFYCFQEDAEN